MFNLIRAGAALGKGNNIVDEDPHQAVHYYMKGLAAARSRPSAQFALRVALVEAYRTTGELDNAITILRSIEETARRDEVHPSARRRSYRIGRVGVTALEARLGALEDIAELHGEAEQPEAQLAALQRLAEGAGTSDAAVRARALRQIAELELELGRTEQAKATIRLALDEAVARNDTLGHAQALHIEACIVWDDEDRAAARDRLATALNLFDSAADLRGQSRVERQLGLFAWHDGDLIAARDHFAKSLQFARAARSETLADAALDWLDRIGKRMASAGTDPS